MPKDGPELPLDTAIGDDGAVSTRVRLPQGGNYSVKVWLQNAAPVSRIVRVQPARRLWLMVLIFCLIALAVPYALQDPAKPGPGAWYHLLSEKMGGYSLSKVQLFIWFLPAAILYGALTFTLRAYVEINMQLSLLLGLSGATTLLGTASSPPTARGANGTAVAPDLSDMVSDWDSNGDVSRYQYLLLSIFGAVGMVASFGRQLEMPAIPTQLLYLVAGSQGTYLATKAIKAARSGAASPTQLPGLGRPASSPATAAPASMTPAAPALDGSFVPADS
jgi:hypothetical protein